MTKEKQAHAETFWVQGSSLVPFDCTQGSTKKLITNYQVTHCHQR